MHFRPVAGLLLLSLNVAFGEQRQDNIDWQPWSDSVFAQAKKEGRALFCSISALCGVTGATSSRSATWLDSLRRASANETTVAVQFCLFVRRIDPDPCRINNSPYGIR